jgi:diguanylate cyclase (GGDEF)-like protein/PAS domain S-box-containing protein
MNQEQAFQEGVGGQPARTIALDGLPFAALLCDPLGRVVAANRRWFELSGLSWASSLGWAWMEALAPEGAQRILADIATVAGGDSVMAVDHQVARDAQRRWTKWSLSSHHEGGETLVVLAVADVHEERTREESLYHLATHDSLTGLVNSSHFIECTDLALRRRSRRQSRLAVVFIDLDGFKHVNDLGGHALGDRVLAAVASRLLHTVRREDVVGRIGGDEFAVLCEDFFHEHHVQIVVDRIAKRLGEAVDLDGESWAISASVGAAIDGGSADTAVAMLDRADRAMYRVKSNRRPGDDRGSSGEVVTVQTSLEGLAQLRPVSGLTVMAGDSGVIDVRETRETGQTTSR